MVPKYWSESINPSNQMMVWLLPMLLAMLLLPICNLLLYIQLLPLHAASNAAAMAILLVGIYT